MTDAYPKLVEELVPKLMSLGEVQKVLQQLLREQVSIRDLGAILDVLVETAPQSKNIVHLVESVRQSLGRGLVQPLLDAEGGLRVVTLEHLLESEILNTFDPQRAALTLGDGAARTPSEFLRRTVESVKRLTAGAGVTAPVVLLCPSPARYHLRRWLEPFLPKIVVLAPGEIPPDIRVRSIGTVG
jgi:flagellar biosynthesis protein FlhA